MDKTGYTERLSSPRTHLLFTTLTMLFLGLFAWSWYIVSWNSWTMFFLCIAVFFLFYSINYRILKIYISTESLQLKFGIFTWTIPIANIKNSYIDEDTIWRFGGAGIHFMFIKGKYRAFFTFLEYPRVVISLKKKKGPVHEIAFTTQHPEQIMGIIQSSLS